MRQNLKSAAMAVLAFMAGTLGLIVAGLIAHYVPWQEFGEGLLAIART